jgi:hypothetical protein
MTETLQPILALLDEGLRLYRRHFVDFVLITASWFVPVAIMTGTAVAAESWISERYAALIGLLFMFVGLLVLFPLLIYLIGGLSRAAVAASTGRPVRFREAMAIHPLRATGMGCFTIVYSIIAQFASSLMSMACVCPLYFFGFLAVGFIGAAADAGNSAALGLIAAGIFLVGLYLSMMLIGATGSGLFYGLQPWVQEARPFGESLQLSMQLIIFRFGRNLLVWCLAALLTAAAGLTVMATIGTLLPLPLMFALGSESPVAQAVALGAWLIGFMVVLPPLPIWMALLYQRNRAAYEGADLRMQVEAWSREPRTTQRVPDREPPADQQSAVESLSDIDMGGIEAALRQIIGL